MQLFTCVGVDELLGQFRVVVCVLHNILYGLKKTRDSLMSSFFFLLVRLDWLIGIPMFLICWNVERLLVK